IRAGGPPPIRPPSPGCPPRPDGDARGCHRESPLLHGSERSGSSLGWKDYIMLRSGHVCGAPVEEFMNFGRMPIANGFLTPVQLPSESFFGPRQLPLVENWELLPVHRRRLCVKPGITGRSQVSGRNDLTFDEWMAQAILLQTVPTVLDGRGAR